MKAIASTFMLALLLYHMLGLSVALLDFEKAEKVLAGKQVGAIEVWNTAGSAGSASWQQFSELSEMIQEINASQQAPHPASQWIKLLNDLIKMYLPVNSVIWNYANETGGFSVRRSFADRKYLLISQISELHSPPPEAV
ncbi:hypothetical protein [Dyadobacter bucti]|uniref:hypothetical protein n=1 Tax=Dyadobacter bucti TaxID=2572203 RepID=UPI001108B6B3|nr:hypothetical protein [Dyadobacter bucti]